MNDDAVTEKWAARAREVGQDAMLELLRETAGGKPIAFHAALHALSVQDTVFRATNDEAREWMEATNDYVTTSMALWARAEGWTCDEASVKNLKAAWNGTLGIVQAFVEEYPEQTNSTAATLCAVAITGCIQADVPPKLCEVLTTRTKALLALDGVEER